METDLVFVQFSADGPMKQHIVSLCFDDHVLVLAKVTEPLKPTFGGTSGVRL